MVKRSNLRKMRSKRAKHPGRSSDMKTKIMGKLDRLLGDISEKQLRTVYNTYGPSMKSKSKYQSGGNQEEIDIASSVMMVSTLVIFALYHRNNPIILDLFQVLLDSL